jgi:hypothetical protein
MKDDSDGFQSGDNLNEILTLLSTLKTKAEVEATFSSLAQVLLNESQIVLGQSSYDLCEIEFYLRTPCFVDPFIHGHKRQKTFGEWYVHRKGEEGFPSRNRSGLDLSAGGDDSWGGILIRRIKSTNGEVIDGSGCVAVHLQERLNISSGKEFAKMIEVVSPTEVESPLRLVSKEKSSKLILRSPRVGLRYSEKNREERLPFICRHYRYQTNPHETSKNKHTLFLALLEQGYSCKDALDFSKVSSIKGAQYISYFESGKIEGVPADFSRLNVEKECALMGALS